MTDLATTRRALHAVAEQLLAGPQYRSSGTIRLRVVAGGFATVAQPELRVDGDDLVVDGVRLALDGASITALATEVGLSAGAPEGIYPPSDSIGPDDVLRVDVAIAAKLAEAFTVGDAALRMIAPDAEPVLWPEHFDVAIRVDEVNYGVSPGDGFLGEPYAYVGVDDVPSDPFWNAPFGAARRSRSCRALTPWPPSSRPDERPARADGLAVSRGRTSRARRARDRPTGDRPRQSRSTRLDGGGAPRSGTGRPDQ